jgi:hypothetical protein
VVGSVFVGWWLVRERDFEVDLDSPAGDADLFDHEAHQPSAACEVEAVEGGGDTVAESGESAADAVVGGQVGAAAAECVLLSRELGATGCQYAGATGEFFESE